MEQNYSTTKTAGNGTNSGPGYPPNASWSDPDGVTGVGDPASIGFFEGGQDGDSLVIDQFGFELPDFAIIDGVSINVTGSQTGTYGDISLSAGIDAVDIGALNQTYGDSTDLWGADSISVADVNDSSFGATIQTGDVSGGDGIAEISLVEITVYWHIDITAPESDVPTRIDYKVYANDGTFLGLLPKVTSKLGFAQDINSAGAAIEITCGKFVKNEVTVSPLLTEDGEVITTEDDLPILAASTDLVIAPGNSPDKAIFKNGNRVKAWLYNRYYPNGKLVFSGQINRVAFKYGGADASVKMVVYSDGLDLNNFIARGYPFSYTTDVSQTSQNGYVTVTESSKGAGWQRYGQSWIVGGSVTNVGAIVLKLKGTATVTLSVYDNVNGNLIGSVSRSVANGSATDVQFEMAQLLSVVSSDEVFMAVSVNPGQSIRVYKHGTSSTYANGSMYSSSYSGGSGGGSYVATTGDFYFITKYGTPTTTATYSTDDPTTDMAHGILLDYNARGGYITERDFEATGLSVTYTFVVATIFDALKKVLELSPTGYYHYIDLGTAEIDIKQISAGADFTVVRGRHINELNLALTIEQVKNYLLFSGGETAGVNLYRDYSDSESSTFYGLRTATQSDNRVTVAGTADAIGDSFIEENSDEKQETTLIIKDEHVDITQFTPGKTIGFKNFGNFIDDMVLQIVRREPNFSDGISVLTLGQLPIRMNDRIQAINRGLMNQQTINNPSAPS
jgi:hypothetical protein